MWLSLVFTSSINFVFGNNLLIHFILVFKFLWWSFIAEWKIWKAILSFTYLIFSELSTFRYNFISRHQEEKQLEVETKQHGRIIQSEVVKAPTLMETMIKISSFAVDICRLSSFLFPNRAEQMTINLFHFSSFKTRDFPTIHPRTNCAIPLEA